MPKYSADFITKLENEQPLNPLNFNMFIEIVVFIKLKVGDKMKGMPVPPLFTILRMLSISGLRLSHLKQESIPQAELNWTEWMTSQGMKSSEGTENR